MKTMTTRQIIRQLGKLKKSVLKDGEVDWEETEQLHEAIRPLSVQCGFVFEDYDRLLMKCREDGNITPEESRQLAIQLELLYRLIDHKRQIFWMSVAIVILAIACTLSLVCNIVSSTDASALREPATGEMPLFENQ